MSRSHECYDCGDRTEAYDDAYCTECWVRRQREARGAPQVKSETQQTSNQPDLAEFIVHWLENRNRGEFREMFLNQRVGDRALLLDELREILKHGGKPPNWL